VTLGSLLVISNIERLAVEKLVVNLVDSLRSSFAGGEVAETKAPAVTVGGPHDLDALDNTEFLEEVAEIVISDIISKPLDVKVGLGRALLTEITLTCHGSLTLFLLLGTGNVELQNFNLVLLKLFLVFTFTLRTNENTVLPFEFLSIKSIMSLLSTFVVGKVDETEATADTLLVNHNLRRSDGTKLAEEFHQVIDSELRAKVLDIKVGVALERRVGTILLGLELFNQDTLTKALQLVLVISSSIESLLGIFNLLKVDKGIATAHTLIVGSHLAGQDGTKLREAVLKTNKINILVQTLHEKVTFVAPSLGGITTAPHGTARLSLDALAIEGIESLLSILMALEIDITVAKRMLIPHITANTDGLDGTALLESVVEVGLSHIRTEITDVEGCIGIGGIGNNGGLISRHFLFF